MENQNGATRTRSYYFLVISLLAIVVGVGIYYTKGQKTKVSTLPTPQNESVVSAENTTNFKIEGGSFFFKPNELKVKLGQTVKIEFTNSSGMHDFVLDEFNVNTKVIGAGKTETFEFVADKLGEFEFYCSVGNHRQQGMVGKLVVGN